ncbi:hypothetical protein [Paenibacillus spongiae]|uniref:Uncharacterized protein n=1 Tax=Paenibacillus spongiae TaxID=2909671 RepID=A0ABY5SGC3_9BACL|nr:hypothetical protein [Paenibacillus spongiae]UVI32618.1 hypothetical protein L1F29_12670 [Paenibacillus spongiae]
MRPIHHGRPEARHIPPLDERGKERGPGRRGEHHRRRGGEPGAGGGAQTYRRGRILTFLEQLQIKRATLARQLGEAEFQSIQPVISGELKAIEQVISDYMYLFELREEDRIMLEPGESSPEANKED